MKKFVIGLTCGIILSATTVVAASESIKVVLFPSKIIIQGEVKNLPSDLEILNYNNSAYVPLRFFSETLGAKVDYIHEPRTISLYLPGPKLDQGDVDINADFVKTKLKLGFSKSQVNELLGMDYREMNIKDSEGGIVTNRTYWRYDVGLAEGYIVKNNSSHEGWADIEGIEQGKIQLQVLITWSNDMVSNISAIYKENNEVKTFNINQ